MNARMMLAGVFSLTAGIGMASAGDVPTLPPLSWTGATCSSFREWPGPAPRYYRYCTRRQQGYEAQRDDFYRGSSLQYLGSKLVDCDSTQGWLPSNGNMKTYYCP